jgi:hypothetical protein
MLKVIYAVGLFSVSGLFAAEPTQPTSGTWELNVAKSKFSPGPPWKSQTRTIESTDDSVKYNRKGIDAEGKSSQAEYTAKYDGKDYPLTGVAGTDTIAQRRIDPSTVDFVQKKDGRVAIKGRSRVSKDGKIMTVASKGTNAKGQKFNDVMVFEKQ